MEKIDLLLADLLDGRHAAIYSKPEHRRTYEQVLRVKTLRQDGQIDHPHRMLTYLKKLARAVKAAATARICRLISADKRAGKTFAAQWDSARGHVVPHVGGLLGEDADPAEHTVE